MTSLVTFLAYILYLIYVIDPKSGTGQNHMHPFGLSKISRSDTFRWPRVRGKKKL
jgi:hypothetical protein